MAEAEAEAEVDTNPASVAEQLPLSVANKKYG